MSFDGILVNHGALDEAAADMNKAVNDISARLDRLGTDLRPLYSQWNGEAQRAYDQAKQVWDRTIAEMHLMLAQAGQAVTSSNAEYRDADLKGAATFQA